MAKSGPADASKKGNVVSRGDGVKLRWVERQWLILDVKSIRVAIGI